MLAVNKIIIIIVKKQKSITRKPADKAIDRQNSVCHRDARRILNP